MVINKSKHGFIYEHFYNDEHSVHDMKIQIIEKVHDE